ncbi:hypothetical protein DYB28_013656 [Aphanomyces astaci]|uniref:DDE-1 domain-containing protein n=1 Tax=Aphanomyces astaci TaxID=112090 RepID=A0A9X8HAE0_APHAT|nr:hypothetical protein DYB28_013656 [Aphanomyces astaci]
MTIVIAVTADGTAVPPAFILPGKSCAVNVLVACAVPDALVSATPKSFMNADLFDSWLETFGEWKLKARSARHAVLVMDNCSSHLTYNSLAIFEAYGVYIVGLPPNSTHLLQPLDVTVFRSFKAKISNGVTRHLQSLNTTTLPRPFTIQIAGDAYNSSFRTVHDADKPSSAIVNGFGTCGVRPLSLPQMLHRWEKATMNGVRSDQATAAWLKTKQHAREEVDSTTTQGKGTQACGH